MDAGAVWQAAKAYQRRVYSADLIARVFPTVTSPSVLALLDGVLTLAPVVDQGELFQLAPDLDKPAPVRAHRWLVAVRGWAAWQVEGEPGETEAAALRDALGAAAEPLMGSDVRDIAACDATLSRVRAVLTADADALGTVDPDAPLRLVQSPMAWLRGLAAGVLPLGTASQKQALLRAQRAPIICDDLAHGEAVQRFMRRQVPDLPRVMVAA
jgi:hypothetical protein